MPSRQVCLLAHDTVKQYALRVRMICPERADACASMEHVYPGMALGPSVSLEDGWKPALEKLHGCVHSVAHAGVAPSMGRRHVSSHIMPVLSYVAQVTPPTRKAAAVHGTAVERRVLDFPHRPIPRAAVARLREVGLRVPPVVELDSRAASISPAQRHAAEVREVVALLRSTRERFAPVAAIGDQARRFDRELWEAPAIAQTMAEALLLAEAHAQDPAAPSVGSSASCGPGCAGGLTRRSLGRAWRKLGPRAARSGFRCPPTCFASWRRACCCVFRKPPHGTTSRC